MDSLDLILSSPVAWCVTAATIVYLLYRYGTSNFDYFSSQGIPGPKPIPFVGNMWGVWKKNIPEYDRELSKKYGRTFGMFDGHTPNLCTTDVDLIKAIFVKDFEHFVNRREFEANGKYVRKMVSVIKDQEWKDVRSSVTPAFTTGKIKRMSGLIKECADRLSTKFEMIAKTEGKIEAKMQFSAFTMDVIARCAFGMQFKNLDEKGNPFMEKARQVFNQPALKTPLVLLPFMSPTLMKLFGERLFASGFSYFIKVLEGLVKERAISEQKYNDFIEVATEAITEFTSAEKGPKKHSWSKEEVQEIVIAQSTLFLLAGFDTTGTTLTNAIYLLAKNPEIQEKLYEQIRERLETHGEVKHEMVLNFPYLDHVVNETLRMFPAAPRIERQCNKDYTFNGITIKEGVIVTVMSYALHYDKEYYSDPETFNPDRWESDSPIKPNPNTYMPFGMGPRNCIGMRFAMEEMKIALATILSRFRFFPVAETPEKIQFEDGFQGIIQPIHATVGLELRS